MTNIGIIGAGGIGSYLSQVIFELITVNLQIKVNDVTITVFDHDDVSEKNILYQNFKMEDILENKSECIGSRYGFFSSTKKITHEDELDEFDIVIGCVDNTPARRIIYKWGDKSPNNYWIDLRSEGRAIAYFTKTPKNTAKSMEETLNKEANPNTSCQLPYELENNIIQLGNRIVANIGAQLLLNKLRDDFNAGNFTARF